jgi:tetratricopeptide (TPR) repeat protein
MAPGDEVVIQRLIELYEKMGNLRGLVELLEDQAQHAPDPQRAAQLRVRVAEIYAGPLGDPQRAVSQYRVLVEKDPSNAAAHAALAGLYMGDAAAAPLAIEEHRHLLKLEPARVESVQALFKLWAGIKQSDKAFCAAGVLHFFRSAREAEVAFYAEGRNRLPQEPANRLLPPEVDLVMHPKLRNSPLVEVLRAIGDQLGKLYPPDFEALGIDRRVDRLKPDHAVHKAIRAAAHVFGVEEFEVYQARRGLMFLETTEPLAICVGQDVVRKFNAREQKFLIGRALFGLLNKTPVLHKLPLAEVADLLGNAVRAVYPEYEGLGRRNDEMVKQLRKTLSRKALKALEAAAPAMTSVKHLDLAQVLEWFSCSADRAGLVLCGDVAAGINMLLREDPSSSPLKSDAVAEAVQTRADLREAIAFTVSDDFFRLRQKLGFAV